ncbi:recombinase family protein [Haematomicrobium sanguinis]|uniref:recombinase family protein n=1 Tax=Haematomicrobium sanguinis TaxID=479106 RepID=UPI0009494FDD
MPYQRLSTREHASTGGRDDGISIPTQRRANARKAEEFGARIVAEFVDTGESARSADRPDLKRMLDYIASHQVTYCVVHKVDRLAHNGLDAGVPLVSATENIAEIHPACCFRGSCYRLQSSIQRISLPRWLRG